MAQGNNAKRQGSNSHELYLLQALNRIVNALPASATGNATEVTLQNVESILQNVENNTIGLATETTLQLVDTNASTIATNTTGVSRTPGIIRPNNTSGNLNTVAATFYSVSLGNVGTANGTVLGATIKPGEILNFSADAVNNFFNSFVYDATGTEFIIIYVA